MTTTTQTLTLKTAIGTYGHTAALKDGSVTPQGIKLDHVEVTPIIAAFRRMCRNLEFDVCEMAVTTYLTAKAFNKPFTALPVVPVRAFHHGGMSYNVKSGIKEPKDLEGRKVGVRAYTVTSGVWARGILASEYGVDLNKVTWVINDEEHVKEYTPPSNVQLVSAEKSFIDMMLAGEIDAAIGAGSTDSPDIKPLIPSARQAEADWFKRTGIYPINHMIVVKDEVLASNPWVAAELLAAFKASKQRFLDHLDRGQQLTPDDQSWIQRKALVGGDPLPYGVEGNRKGLEAVIQYAYDQKILPKKYSVEEIFAPNALE
jgi:4,5-dihydroxyphthalate decarboxylase